MRDLRRLWFSGVLWLAMSGHGIAAVETLIGANVPLLAGESVGFSIREVTFLVSSAIRETRVVAVWWPYKVNSPLEDADGKNINPASMVWRANAMLACAKTEHRRAARAFVSVHCPLGERLELSVAEVSDTRALVVLPNGRGFLCMERIEQVMAR